MTHQLTPVQTRRAVPEMKAMTHFVSAAPTEIIHIRDLLLSCYLFQGIVHCRVRLQAINVHCSLCPLRTDLLASDHPEHFQPVARLFPTNVWAGCPKKLGQARERLALEHTCRCCSVDSNSGKEHGYDLFPA